MKRIILVHTVRSVLDSFGDQLKENLPDVLIDNMLDEFLVTDATRKGLFSPANRKRLELVLAAADLANPDLIVVTCSSLTPYVHELQDILKAPVVCIDDAMTRQAVLAGPRIHVLATAPTTVGPTVQKIKDDALSMGKEVQVEYTLCEDAINALRKGDKQRHDDLVLVMASHVGACDVIVLAQASMSHLQAAVQTVAGYPVLASVPSCIESIRRQLS